MSIEKKDEITLILFYNSQIVKTLKCNKHDKLEKVFRNFASQIGEFFNSLIFLYSGDKITDFTKTFNQTINELDKAEKKMNILVYNMNRSLIYSNQNYINFIFLLNSKDFNEIKAPREEIIKKVCNEYANKKSLNFDSLLFKYGGKEIDLNKKFDDLANIFDKNCNGMPILVYNKNPLKIKFLYNEELPYEMNCYKEDKIKDVFNKYAIDKSLNIDNLSFEYEIIPITLDEQITFNHLINNDYDKSNISLFLTNNNLSYNDINEIDIIVKQKNYESQSFLGKYKNYIAILSIIIILIIIIVLICYFLFHGKPEHNYSDTSDIANETDSDTGKETDSDTAKETDSDIIIVCEEGYNLVDGKCKADYLIKATYLSLYENEPVTLISSSSTSFISKMIIDGEIIKPTYKYNFLVIGYHTVYYKFNKSSNTIFSFFRGITKLKKISFSDFNDYPISIEFSHMFYQCSNLTSVYLSNFSYNSNIKHNLNNMFSGCVNLTYVNFNLSNFNVLVATNMFYDCKSLTFIDISRLNMSEGTNFDNMFYNCISLKKINLKNFYLKSAFKINYMFYNCISLTSLDVSSFRPNGLSEMNSLFQNCISLNSINLDKLYTFNVKAMNKLFYNCTSLKSINISMFVTKDVKDLSYMFGYCSSLVSIDLSNFDTNEVTDMNSMFFHCHSLTSINFKNLVTSKVTNMSFLFSHCYSLLTIDLSSFNTEKVLYFDGMFSHCYSLKSINILHFNTKSFTTIKYMFYGCYSLTSIDLSNFNRTYSHNYNYIFYDCPNLNFVNITPFNYYSNDNNLFNKNISSNGTLILDKNYYEKLIYYKNYIPSNWTIIFA